MRRFAAILTALVGIAVAGIGARTIEGATGALSMRWTFFGAQLSESPLAQFAAGFESQRLLLHAAALVIAIVCGVLTAKWFGSKRVGLTIACCAAWSVALAPEIAYFVATRET